MRGVDGVVFVADSLAVRRDENILSLKNLQENLSSYKKSIFKIPLVLQYNKRDLLEQSIPVLSVERLEKDLNARLKAPAIEASALTGSNVAETLKKIVSVTLTSIEHTLT